jgi:hypothetical protein
MSYPRLSRVLPDSGVRRCDQGGGKTPQGFEQTSKIKIVFQFNCERNRVLPQTLF